MAEYCLQQTEIAPKIATTHYARQLLAQQRLSLLPIGDIADISTVQFPERPVLLKPREMPRRGLNTVAGKIAFFHALAHIEWIAIYLAWDILYRFRGLPNDFYQDWLTIADEEAQHFTLLSEHLAKLGCQYGDLPAHQGLWLHAEETADNLLARLAIVPRCMEARGLDVTPPMIEKFKQQGDEQSVSLLSRILEDEIGHVKVGSYWFKWLCEQQGIDHQDQYQLLITQFYTGKPKGPFNRELRIMAGFSHAEIDWLEIKI